MFATKEALAAFLDNIALSSLGMAAVYVGKAFRPDYFSVETFFPVSSKGRGYAVTSYERRHNIIQSTA